MKVEKALAGGLASVAALAAGSHAASAQDWTGFYAGLSANSNYGDLPFVDSGDDYTLESGAVLGGFVGTRWNAAGHIMGAELAFQGEIGASTTGDPYSFNSLVDAKLSFGTPVGNALVYGFAGISGGKVSASGGDYSYSAFGANFGVGADYRVSDNLSVGVEYTHRLLSGYDGENPNGSFNNGTLSLRASFHF